MGRRGGAGACLQHLQDFARWGRALGAALGEGVGLIEEEVKSYECVPIVPILKLNSFIREMGTGFDIDQSFEDAEPERL